ncbi:MAG: hypothetical protein QN198_09815 [Armatimonadota bacterium]|nr:hypothetical protein [Armatimonadota bacterium]MDR5703880.1 hypothetical protein [Armatimonadota bacterium]MDR7435802.1 hypothetical protein [Armatimonadota bacterium]
MDWHRLSCDCAGSLWKKFFTWPLRKLVWELEAVWEAFEAVPLYMEIAERIFHWMRNRRYISRDGTVFPAPGTRSPNLTRDLSLDGAAEELIEVLAQY